MKLAAPLKPSLTPLTSVIGVLSTVVLPVESTRSLAVKSPLTNSIFILSVRLLMFVILLLSLASAEYPERDIKAIVPRIANIVITTISSTNVKAFFVLLIICI